MVIICKEEATQAEASRVLVLRQIGELLGPPREGAPRGNRNASKTTSLHRDVVSPTERNRRHIARLFSEFAPVVDRELETRLVQETPRVSVSRLELRYACRTFCPNMAPCSEMFPEAWQPRRRMGTRQEPSGWQLTQW
jgi:hypothetical protein